MEFAEIFWSIYYSGVRGKRTMAKMRVLKFLPMVKSPIIRGLTKDVVTRGSYEALGKLMRRVVMAGIMHLGCLEP